MSIHRAVLVAVLLLTSGLSASAATIAWNNSAGGNWGTAANWTPAQVPGSGDDAVIALPGTYTVTLNVSASVASLTLGGATGTQTLANAGSTLTLANASSIASSGVLSQSAGTLTGGGALTVDGVVNWTGGTIAGSGILTVNAAGMVVIGGAADKFLNARTINDLGTVRWDQGRILFQNGAVLNNQNLFDIRSDDVITSTSAGGTINNSGTLRKQVATGTTTIIQHIHLANTGTIDILSGTLTPLAATLGAGTNITGTGFLVNGGNVSVSGASTVTGTMNVASGTLGGSSALTVNGILSWTGGTLGGNGTIDVSSIGTLHISSAPDKFLDVRTINNSGTIEWLAGRILFQNGGLLRNLAGGTFDIRHDGTMTSTSAGGTFRNLGLILKSAGAGTAVAVTHVRLENDGGTLHVPSGSLTFINAGLNDGTQITGTGYRIDGGSNTVTGTVTVAGTATLASGTLNGAGVFQVNGLLQWTGGTMATSGGTTLIAAGGAMHLSGGSDKFISVRKVENHGITSWGDAGRLLFQDHGQFTNHPGGIFEAQSDSSFTSTSVGGSFRNYGTFRKTAGAGSTTVVVHVSILNDGGTFDVTSGTITIDSTMTLAGTSSFTGTGNTQITGAITGTATIAGTRLVLLGTLNGNGVMTVSGTMGWNAGSMATSGGLTNIAAGATLNIAGAADKFLDTRVLNNYGTVNWTGGRILFQNHGTFNNHPGALFDITTDSSFTSSSVGGTFNNSGTFRKSGGSGVTTIVVHVKFNNNDAVIDVLSGSIVSDSPMAMSGTNTFTGAGAFKVTGPLSGTTTLAGNVELAGGSFTGSGTITIAGTLTWTTGTMNGSGLTVIASGGTMKITGTFDRFLDGRTLDNGGTTIWDGGRLFFQNNALFRNAAGALFETRHDDVFISSSVGGRFTNEGTFRKTTATGTTTIVVHVAVTSNSGTFDIQTGTLTIDSPLTLSGTSSFTGAGTTKITGVMNGTGTIAGRLQLAAGGNLSGSGAITIAGTLDWVAGMMSTGGGSTVIAPGGVLNLSGGDRFLDARMISNSGTVNWTAGRLFFQNNGAFNNQSGGVFNVQVDSQFTSSSVGGTFNNAGTFTKNTPGTVTMTHVSFTNGGLLDVQSGTLRFEKSFTQTAGTTVVHGRIESTTGVTIQGGVLGGTGTFAANVTSSGEVRPGTSPGTLTIQGNYTQTAGGVLTIEIAGAASYDQLAITGTFNAGGTLSVVSPYSPADGETFPVVTFAARNGDFANVTGLNLGNGKSYARTYSPAALILTAVDDAANLHVTVADAPDPVNQGEELTYTVTVTNGANSGATGVTMTDTLPSSVTFESATPSQGSCSGTEIVECNLGSLAAGAFATVTIVVTPTQYGTIGNQVEVAQNEPDPNLDNNTFAATTAVNGTPVAGDDTGTTDEETPVTVDVLDNDLDPEEDLLVIATFTQGTNGAVLCQGTECTYEPEANFSGTDTFTYAVSDPGNAMDTATVTITVNEVADENEPPVAVDDAATTSDSVSVNVLANDSDPDGDALTIVAHSEPLTGQVRCSETRCTYWARHGFRGSDSFTYTVSDGSDTAKATVRITVAREGCPATVALTDPSAGASAPASGTFRWTATGADYYDVYLGPAGSGCSKRLARVTEPFVDYTNLAENGPYEWRVEAVATGCGVVTSPCSGFTIRPACTPPAAPAASVVAQASSGQTYTVSWASLGAGVHYEVEEADNASFTGAAVTRVDGTSVSFTHVVGQSAEPFFYRVRAIAACLAVPGPYSTPIRIVITPLPQTIERNPQFNVPVGSTHVVVQPLFLPGDGETTQQFSVETDEPWLRVVPSSGLLPPSGFVAQLLADPTHLPNGTVTGTVIVTITPLAAPGAPQSHGTTTVNLPVSLNLVTPVLPVTSPEATPAHALIIPTVGHLGGAASQWQSDVRVTNTSSTTMKYQLTFLPAIADAAAKVQQTTIDVQPGVTTALDDIVRNWFGQGALGEASIGFLKIVALTNPSARTVASSRTFNLTANGTLGQFIPAIPFSSFVGKSVSSLAAPILSLQQIAESAAYRTNVGLVEASGKPVSLLMTIFDIAGNTLKELPLSLGAGELRQMNGLLAQNGIAVDDGRIEVRVLGGEGKVTAYASTIDNITNDPLLVSAATLGGPTSTRYVLPGAADIDTGSANWRTDMRVFNDGTEPQLASVVLHTDGREAIERSIVVAPREVKVLDSVVRELFGKTQSGGAIHVSTAAPSRLVVTARTYNKTDAGTFGLFAPAVTPEEATGVRERTLHIPQVEDSSRYRTNVGVAEVSGKEATIEIGVSLPNAKATPNVRVTLAPNEFRQFVGILRSMGLGNVYNARVTVRVVEGNGRVTAYGAIVDAETNDPTYVPAQ